jgi:hypothetical protein
MLMVQRKLLHSFIWCVFHWHECCNLPGSKKCQGLVVVTVPEVKQCLRGSRARISFCISVLSKGILMLSKQCHSLLRRGLLRTLCSYREVNVRVCFVECAHRISRTPMLHKKQVLLTEIHVPGLSSPPEIRLMFYSKLF